MTDENARRVANGLMTLAGAAVTYVIVTNPRLRRVVFDIARKAIVTGLPAYLMREVKDAWAASGQPV